MALNETAKMPDIPVYSDLVAKQISNSDFTSLIVLIDNVCTESRAVIDRNKLRFVEIEDAKIR